MVVCGFMVSRLIISAAELDLFTLLAKQICTADEVADDSSEIPLIEIDSTKLPEAETWDWLETPEIFNCSD